MLETLPKRSKRQRRKERRRGIVILLVFVLLLGGAAAAGARYYEWATGASGPRTPLSIQIPRGATGGQVADILTEHHVVRSAFIFRLFVRFRHLAGGFQAGEYQMTANMTVSQALAALRAGPAIHAVAITFPEGWTVAQIAARSGAVLRFPPRQLVKLSQSGQFSLPPYLPAHPRSLEGFLFPDTYDFLRTSKPADVINLLLREFGQQVAGLPWENATRLHVTPYQVVIVASMIEREARFQADRPKIAAVIYNRLRKHMMLQIDATVEYALGTYKPKLTQADLKVKSPYNTYLHAGLPPTPIANPGLASLEAALSPASVNYLYYVVIDAQGHHAFTDNYQEFLRLQARYRG